MRLQVRVTLITGAGAGIGQATAGLFAREGALVGTLDLTHDKLSETVNSIQQTGGPCSALSVDVSQPSQVQNAIDQLVMKWGHLDIVFANVGINGVWAPLEELDLAEWDETLAINLKGTFLTVKYAIPFLKQRGGSIIITSSVNGTRMFSNTGATAYACPKAAQGAVQTSIHANTQMRNLENIREPMEFPKGESPLTDGKPAVSDQIAQAVLFLASDAASHVTGTEMWIDGGQSLLRG
ncbi:MAG: SDR family oxidoreductase [Chloroflexi bacterium]|nr:SDR family oxidoreductase [Chloroflexota bacterium]